MKVEGRYTFHLPIEVVYNALKDEALIRRALPGHVYFRMTSPTHYEAAVELDVPRFAGRYSGELQVLDTRAPTYYRLRAAGEGPDRRIHAEGIVELTEVAPEQTEVYYLGHTDALDDYNRFFRMAAAPIAARLANRGLHHLEQVIHARRQSGEQEAGSAERPKA